MTELDVATNVIITYLKRGFNVENMNDLYEIKRGNKQTLKAHIKALKNIFEKAMEELEKDEKSLQTCKNIIE